MKNFRVIYIFLSIVLVSCSGGPAGYRSGNTQDETIEIEVLSESSYSVTIKHNAAGENMALRYAIEKCESFGKKTAYQESPVQYRTQNVSTWKCIDLDLF